MVYLLLCVTFVVVGISFYRIARRSFKQADKPTNRFGLLVLFSYLYGSHITLFLTAILVLFFGDRNSIAIVIGLLWGLVFNLVLALAMPDWIRRRQDDSKWLARLQLFMKS